jgi:amino acid transporter
MATFVSLSSMGVVNGTLFSVGRMTMAAAKNRYLPEMFGRLGFPHASGPGAAGKRKSDASDSEPAETCADERTTLLPPGPEDNQTANTKPAGDENERPWQTPILAMLLNTVFTSVYIATGSFEFLIIFVGMSVWFSLFLAVLGLIILRYREPELHRPYKVPLFVPVVFTVTSFAVVVASMVFSPFKALFFLVLGLVGSAVRWRIQKSYDADLS